MSAKLVCLAGPARGNTFSISQEKVTIGRSEENAICIADRSISRRHCEIEFRDGAFYLKDLGSANRTLVNGVPVEKKKLNHGDELNVAHSVLVFLLDAEGGEPIATDDGGPITPSTVEVRAEDSVYRNFANLDTRAVPDARVTRDMKCLLQAAEAVSSVRGLEALSRRIFDLLGSAIPARNGALMLDALSPVEWKHRFQWRRDGGQSAVSVPSSILRRVFQAKVSLLTNNAMEQHSDAESIVQARIRSMLAVPILVSDQVAGILYLDSDDPAIQFTRDDLELLTGFSAILAGALDSALRVRDLQTENQTLKAEAGINRHLIGNSPPMQAVLNFIRKVAASDTNVLLGGESGTGKELVARAIHRNSRRSQRPFVAINCAALTESLLESEMFGHEKGAFTGAVAQKKGKIEEAAGGTLFLDEIGELAAALQAKLLRVIQEREFDRVGGTKTIKADIRLIAATNRNLKEAVEKGTFRQDLYFRLDVVSTRLPALREHPDDIPALAEHFAAKYAAKARRYISGISPEAMACLRAYDWPGNVRELENAIERSIVLGSTPLILPEDLPQDILEQAAAHGGAPGKYQERLRLMKRQLVVAALEESEFSYVEAAKALGLHPNNLHRLIRNLGIKVPGKRG